jgi:hypothetical protein
VHLLDRDDKTQWGLWVEVAEATSNRVVDLWSAPDVSSEPAFPARIANQIAGYPPTIGLGVAMRLTGPTTRPSLELHPDDTHPFAIECRRRVTTARVMEWLHAITGHKE